MSQQINLLLPELRPRFDWLGLPVVTGVVLAGLFLLFLIAQGQAMRLERSKNQEATIKGELFAMQLCRFGGLQCSVSRCSNGCNHSRSH